MNKKEYHHQYYLDHKEDLSKYFKEKGKEYRKNNKEKIKLRKQKYYQKNNERLKIKSKKYYKMNPEVGLRYRIKRFNKFGEIFNISNRKFAYALQNWSKSIRKRSENLCEICNNKSEISHHIFHKSKYPKLSLNLNNGVSLCKSCHNQVHGWFR